MVSGERLHLWNDHAHHTAEFHRLRDRQIGPERREVQPLEPLANVAQVGNVAKPRSPTGGVNDGSSQAIARTLPPPDRTRTSIVAAPKSPVAMTTMLARPSASWASSPQASWRVAPTFRPQKRSWRARV